MTLTPVRVTGKYVSADGLSAVDPVKLTVTPAVKLPEEQYIYPVPAKLKGDGEFLLPLFADSASTVRYTLRETLGESARTFDVLVPAGASGELALKDLSGYAQPAGVGLTTRGGVSPTALGAAFVTVVQHGANANVARPANAVSVLWIGSVEPVNMAEGVDELRAVTA